MSSSKVSLIEQLHEAMPELAADGGQLAYRLNAFAKILISEANRFNCLVIYFAEGESRPRQVWTDFSESIASTKAAIDEVIKDHVRVAVLGGYDKYLLSLLAVSENTREFVGLLAKIWTLQASHDKPFMESLELFKTARKFGVDLDELDVLHKSIQASMVLKE